jgi:hypothetical protein
MKAVFRKSSYEVVFTDHAKLQMLLRELSEADVLHVIETGEARAKNIKNKFWVYKELKGRKDNLVSVSISIEDPHLIVITTMVNWRPQ